MGCGGSALRGGLSGERCQFLERCEHPAVAVRIGHHRRPVSPGHVLGLTHTAANLTRPQGFSGVDGIVRLGQSGLSQRGLAVLEVQKFGAAVVDPAPSSFQPTTLSAAE